jgi:hypothetical protein
MKPGIMDLNKWASKTALAVERICQNKQAPCVGFCLVFFDPLGEEETRWNYVIELAHDPHSPPEDAEQKKVTQLFEMVAEAIRRVMSGDYVEDLRDYEVRGSFH